MPSTEVTMKQGLMITNPKHLIAIKEAEIEQGEKVLGELAQIEGVSKWKVSRVRGRINFLRRFTEKLKEGFLPIPRMEYQNLKDWSGTIVIDALPIEAITQIAGFQGKFTRLGVVRPRGRGGRRDPFLIGILSYGNLEEHFVLAWWRPDMMLPSQLW